MRCNLTPAHPVEIAAVVRCGADRQAATDEGMLVRQDLRDRLWAMGFGPALAVQCFTGRAAGVLRRHREVGLESIAAVPRYREPICLTVDPPLRARGRVPRVPNPARGLATSLAWQLQESALESDADVSVGTAASGTMGRPRNSVCC